VPVVPPSSRVGAAPANPAPLFGPSRTEQRIVLKDGRTLGFAEYGDLNGEPVLEFHGWPSCRLEASIYDEPAKKVGVRIIAVDRPGFGISTYKKGFRITDWPSDVVELADVLGLERFAVAGISSGSPYALACARFIPERLNACALVSGMSPLKVEGECLNPWQFVDPKEIQIATMANIAPCVARQAFRYIAGQIIEDPHEAMKQFMKKAPPCDKELLADKAATRSYQQTVAECSRGGSKGLIESIGLEMKDWGFRLRDITAHVSIWQGGLDNVVLPASAKYMASRLPNHTLHLIPDAGHLTIIARYAEAMLRECCSSARAQLRAGP
jgi:pimeloyl-ACP methyl ester carboxylesterase